MQVSVQVDMSRVRQSFDRAHRRAKDMRPAWQQVSRLVLQSIQRNFAEGGRPSRWAPRKDNLPHPLLIKSGRMLASLRARSGSNFAEVSERAPYAIYHHTGTGRMPARKSVLLQPEDEREIVEVLEQHILRPLL
ncbi:MAG: phage virion morphogenesis protein [Myxococcales bacterium]|nr:phage virion morphogenesis protein [Myxococcales bacterium]